MLDDPRLLVVDDEAVICQACRRVFTRQGFQVEHSSDATEGLRLASERDYAAILLDIKMPQMDGLEFLAQLRKAKPNVPVILMTGYPSIPNAASAVRLGASDYVTKPFTPEEITQAVQRMLSPQNVLKSDAPAEAWAAADEEVRFCDEAWFRPGKDGTARVGAMLSFSGDAAIAAVVLPKIGEVVFQGLPLAGVTIEGRPTRTVPAPLSGVVVAVNEALVKTPAALATDPCGDGWIAAIAPTRLEEEMPQGKLRAAILLNADAGSAAEQVKKLAALGCVASVAADDAALMGLLRNVDAPVVLLDDPSLGTNGPALAAKLKLLAPSKKVVVLAGRNGDNEAAYRQHSVFYYAIHAFADGEMVQILDGVYRPVAAARPNAKPAKGPSEPVNSISTISRNGKKTMLVTGNGLVRVDEGLGGLLRQKMLDSRLSLETILGNKPVTPVRIADAAAKQDHVVVLLTKDVGRLPGSLMRDSKGEHVSLASNSIEKVTTLIIQPSTPDGGLEGLEARTLAALAQHITNEMASA